MDISYPVGSEVASVDFGFLKSEDVKRLSVKQITSVQVMDRLDHPVAGGLYDLAMGAFLSNLYVFFN